MPSRKALQAAAELAGIRYDGLKMFRLQPNQMPIIQSKAREMLVGGSNRAGKSVSLAARFAAIARDKPIHGPDGKPYDLRLPHQKNRPLLMWVIGLNWGHLGDTIWRLLFKPGAYRIIRDQKTQMFRSFNPLWDTGREDEIKPSFPLIPMSEIEGGMAGISFENRKERQFSKLRLLNGTEILAFASTGDVSVGDPVDEIWVDEKFAIASHYPEWQARIIDPDGRLTVSSLIYSEPAIYGVYRRALEQAQEKTDGLRKEVDIEYVKLTMASNPFFSEESKRKFRDNISDEERMLRWEGEPVIGSQRIYGNFDRSIHAAIHASKELDDPISKILRDRNGEPPNDWTRELILDPGSLRPAVLFGAIPPPDLWLEDMPFFVVYNEIYIPNLSADKLAQEVLNRSRGYVFNRFIIDGQAARQTPMGLTQNVGNAYTDAFAKLKLSCSQTGSYFIPGSPDFESRSKYVERALFLRKCGSPQLRVVIDRCRGLVEQLESNLYQTVKAASGEQLPTKKPARQKDDCREALEYWLSRNPTWVEPPKSAYADKPQWKFYKSLEERFNKKKQGANIVNIGPGDAA